MCRLLSGTGAWGAYGLITVWVPSRRREEAAGGEARSSRSVRSERSVLCAR